jgi:hypothetical protein
MSDIHVLTGNRGMVMVVCHIPVLSSLNASGISYQLAWTNSGRAGPNFPSILAVGKGVGQITQEEADALKAGVLAEIVTEVDLKASSTAPARLQLLQEVWKKAEDRLSAELSELQHYGGVFARR